MQSVNRDGFVFDMGLRAIENAGIVLPMLDELGLSLEYVTSPLEALLEELTDDPSLRSIIGQHFFKGTPAFFVMCYFTIYLDYLYPIGRTGALIELLAEHVREAGVDVHCETPVIRLDPEVSTVTDYTGRAWAYGDLFWCADLKRLYRSIDTATLGEANLAGAIAARRQRLRAVPLPVRRRTAGLLSRDLGRPLLLHPRPPRPWRSPHGPTGSAVGRVHPEATAPGAGEGMPQGIPRDHDLRDLHPGAEGSCNGARREDRVDRQ